MKKNLLVLGDSKNLHIVTEAVFSGRHEVYYAATREKAFYSLKEQNIRLIILYMSMDALGIIEEIRQSGKRFSDTPVLLATPLPTPEILERARQCAVSDIITLPFDPLVFDDRAEELLLKYAPSRELPDAVTGLPKRFVGEARISEMLKNGKKGALVLIDLDHLSFICTAVSDDALVACRDILQEQTKGDAVLAYVKAGAFMVFIPDMKEKEKIEAYAAELIDKILKKIHNEKIYVSVGLAVADRHGKNYEDLYKACDKGLSEARKGGKNKAKFYMW